MHQRAAVEIMVVIDPFMLDNSMPQPFVQARYGKVIAESYSVPRLWIALDRVIPVS